MSEDVIDKNVIKFRNKIIRGTKQFIKGTHRVCPPEVTLEKIKPCFKRVGLTRLANITGLDRIGIPVVLSIRPNAGYLAVDAGKGATVMAASVSAAMECIERYHGEVAEFDSLSATFKEVEANYTTIPFEKLPLIKNSLFNKNHKIEWTLCWDIINQEEVTVPVDLISMNSHKIRTTELIHFQGSSNGLASGNTFSEALCSALYELVERDAVTCHRMASLNGVYKIPVVIQESIDFPIVKEQLKLLNSAGVKAIIKDCSIDTEIPVYMAYIYDTVRSDIGIYRGYGAHAEHEIAMSRAVNEAVQARAIYIAGSRDDFFQYNFYKNKKVNQELAIERLKSTPATVDLSNAYSESTSTFEGDINLIINKLQKVGINQVIAEDLTLENFDISVVRAVVPGLEGYLFNYYQPGKRAQGFMALQNILARGVAQ